MSMSSKSDMPPISLVARSGGRSSSDESRCEGASPSATAGGASPAPPAPSAPASSSSDCSRTTRRRAPSAHTGRRSHYASRRGAHSRRPYGSGERSPRCDGEPEPERELDLDLDLDLDRDRDLERTDG